MKRACKMLSKDVNFFKKRSLKIIVIFSLFKCIPYTNICEKCYCLQPPVWLHWTLSNNLTLASNDFETLDKDRLAPTPNTESWHNSARSCISAFPMVKSNSPLYLCNQLVNLNKIILKELMKNLSQEATNSISCSAIILLLICKWLCLFSVYRHH